MNLIKSRPGILSLAAVLFLLQAGCASNTRTAATWLAAAGNGVKDKAAKYKQRRDALAQARQMSINSVEQTAVWLEGVNSETIVFWSMPGLAKSPQKDLFDAIVAQTEALQARQLKADQLRADNEEQVRKAKSSVASVEEKLAECNKALAALGKEPKLADQITFYFAFFSEVESNLKEMEKKAKAGQESGNASVEAKSNILKSDATTVKP